MKSEMNDGFGLSVEECIFPYCVGKCYSFMGHPLGDCVGERVVTSDLSYVDYRLVSILPVVVGIEVTGYVVVGAWVEEVHDVGYVFSVAGGVAVVNVDFVFVDGDRYFERATESFCFSGVEVEAFPDVCDAFGWFFCRCEHFV